MGGCVTTSNKNTKSVAPLPGPSLVLPVDNNSSNNSIYQISSVGTPSFPTPIYISPTPTPQITKIPSYSRLLPDQNVMSFTTYAQRNTSLSQQNRILQPIIAESYDNLPIPSLSQLPSIIKRDFSKTQRSENNISQFNQKLPVQNIGQKVITKNVLNQYNQSIQNNISEYQQHLIQRSTPIYSNDLSQNQKLHPQFQNIITQKDSQTQSQSIHLKNQRIQNYLPKFSIPPPIQGNSDILNFDKSLLNMNLSQVSNPSPQLYTFSYGMKMPIMGQQYRKTQIL